MIMFILTILDLIVFFTLILTHYNWLVSSLLVILSIVYLLVKGLAFFGELLSMLDIVVAIYFVLFLMGINFNLLFYFSVVFLLYKIVMGFVNL